MDIEKYLLQELLVEKAVKKSNKPIFKLSSGGYSDFYINCRNVTLNGVGIRLIGKIIYDMLKDQKCIIEAVGGLQFGADPISFSVCQAYNNNIDVFSVRKVQKDHGEVRWIEGLLSKGAKVLIVEDVVTTGSSTIKAIERATLEGLNVVSVITLVDRQEGGEENINYYLEDINKDIKLQSLFTRNDLI